MSTQNKNISVDEIMLKLGEFPVVKETTILREAIEQMDLHNFGVVFVINNSEELLGIITAGDITRKLLNFQKPTPALFIDDSIDHANKDFNYIESGSEISLALKIFKKMKIWDLPVIKNKKLVGYLNFHTLADRFLVIN